MRKRILGAFEDMEEMFTGAEVFRKIYPDDENIENASIRLIADTLFAAENTIGFLYKGTGTLTALANCPSQCPKLGKLHSRIN